MQPRWFMFFLCLCQIILWKYTSLHSDSFGLDVLRVLSDYDLFILETNVRTVVHAGKVHTLAMLYAVLIVSLSIRLIKS